MPKYTSKYHSHLHDEKKEIRNIIRSSDMKTIWNRNSDISFCSLSGEINIKHILFIWASFVTVLTECRIQFSFTILFNLLLLSLSFSLSSFLCHWKYNNITICEAVKASRPENIIRLIFTIEHWHLWVSDYWSWYEHNWYWFNMNPIKQSLFNGCFT